MRALALATAIAIGASAPAVAKPAKATDTAQVGLASIYASRFEGLPTASGEPFHQNRATAAHRTLPLGSTVRITNLKTGTHTLVRINDRGPHGDRRRILDLSASAARQLHISGTTPVRVEVVALATR